jgi:hypothetical protein
MKKFLHENLPYNKKSRQIFRREIFIFCESFVCESCRKYDFASIGIVAKILGRKFWRQKLVAKIENLEKSM